MAQIIIEVPDEKLNLVVEAVNSRVNPDLTGPQAKIYVTDWLSNVLRSFVRQHQEAMWMSTFVYYDPVISQAVISPFPASVVVDTTVPE